MASILIATVDQCLAAGVTYTYQVMQTQFLVLAVSAPPTITHQENRARSSQVIMISLSQITRCLHSSSDKTPAEKDLAGQSSIVSYLHRFYPHSY